MIYAISGGGSTTFDEEDWKRRMRAVKTDDELTALVMELPERELHEMSEEDREFSHGTKDQAELFGLAHPTAKTKNGWTDR